MVFSIPKSVWTPRGVWEKSGGHTLGGEVAISLTKFLFVSVVGQIELELPWKWLNTYRFRYKFMLKLHKMCSSLFSTKFAFSQIQLQLAHPCQTVHKIADKIFHMHGKVDCPWISLPTALNILETMFLMLLANN